jgi:hypothetical protein
MTSVINLPMHDGSRLFGTLPQTVLWHALRDHIATLAGTEITAFITDGVTEAWINFRYEGQSFAVDDQFGEYWFFVDDPTCPDQILQDVLGHCELLLH